jgi:hypothetical protein
MAAHSSFVAHSAKYDNADIALNGILAGRATITIVSLKSGVRYTFTVTKSKPRHGDDPATFKPVWFVGLLSAPPSLDEDGLDIDENDKKHYTYLGMVVSEGTKAVPTRKSPPNVKENTAFKAFNWVLSALNPERPEELRGVDLSTVAYLTDEDKARYAGRIPETVEIWHEGRCCRCGRRLTVPESIYAGIGPDCAGKMAPLPGRGYTLTAGTILRKEVKAKKVAKAKAVKEDLAALHKAATASEAPATKPAPKAAAKPVAKPAPVSGAPKKAAAPKEDAEDINAVWAALKNKAADQEKAREQAAYLAEMEEEEIFH